MKRIPRITSSVSVANEIKLGQRQTTDMFKRGMLLCIECPGRYLSQQLCDRFVARDKYQETRNLQNIYLDLSLILFRNTQYIKLFDRFLQTSCKEIILMCPANVTFINLIYGFHTIVLLCLSEHDAARCVRHYNVIYCHLKKGIITRYFPGCSADNTDPNCIINTTYRGTSSKLATQRSICI